MMDNIMQQQIDELTFDQACNRLATAINWSQEPHASVSPGELLDQNRMALSILRAMGQELFAIQSEQKAIDAANDAAQNEADKLAAEAAERDGEDADETEEL